MNDAALEQISQQLNDLVAMYRLVNSETIASAKEGALGDGPRRKVWRLCDGKRSGAEIGREMQVSPQRASQLLSELANMGLVMRNQAGKYERRLD